MNTPFTVMTWNVENLFRPDTGGQKLDQAGYDQKLGNLAEVVQLIDPTIIGLQELGGDGPLGDLQAACGAIYAHRAISTHPDPRGIRVGFLSKVDLTNVEQLVPMPAGAIDDMPNDSGGTITEMGRGALKVSISLDNSEIRLIVAHLKSKLVTYPGGKFSPANEDERARGTGLALARRDAEAVALRVYANHLMNGNTLPLIVLGDMNDGPDAVTTQMLLGPPDGDPHRVDKGDDVRLYNLSDQIPADHRYSRIFNGRPELIDHILVSRELLFEVQQVDTYTRSTPSITADPATRAAAEFSDHAPVFARIELP
jgi:endonuclease/exonuclease/phosphatase family metal-dependent hydrolase